MTDDVNAKLDALHAEIKALRQEQAATRRVINAATMRHSWAKHLVSDLETNPHTQYKVHLYGVIYWLINFPAICYLFFGQPTLWTKLGIFITLIYSIYANFATDYGAMSAAMAAFGDKPPPEIPLQAEHDG
ncbi:MAG: hypothetical protein ABSB59_32350 [Streptosporangiaceae bacterium]|jgi:hypothetical protein